MVICEYLQTYMFSIYLELATNRRHRLRDQQAKCSAPLGVEGFAIKQIACYAQLWESEMPNEHSNFNKKAQIAK
jgi:hypothetical protein